MYILVVKYIIQFYIIFQISGKIHILLIKDLKYFANLIIQIVNRVSNQDF